MTECALHKDRLSALIDGELASADRAAVEDHLEGCASCRDLEAGLRATRASLGEAFRLTLAESPAPPEADSLTGSRRQGSPFVKAAVAVAAAVVIVFVSFYLVPEQTVDASPAAALARAARSYEELEDVELWVRVESKGIRALAELLGGELEDKKRDLARFRCLGAPSGGFVIKSVETFEGPGSEGVAECGYDGRVAWSYDEEERTVTLREPEPGSGLRDVLFENRPRRERAADPLALSYLSWGFVSGLREEEASFDLEEITGPSDRRAGRRRFRLIPEPELDEHGEPVASFAWTRSTIVIDPARDLIERIEMEVTLAGFSLLTITVEVAEVNPGLDARLFRWQSHLPADVTVVHEDEGREK